MTPSGAELEMSRTTSTGDEFSLTKASAEKLVGKPTAGNWSFKLVGKSQKGTVVKLPPSVVSGVVDLNFEDGISGATKPDGEFTLEYLSKGVHDISAFEATVGDLNCESSFGAPNCGRSINLQSNRTGLDFRQSNSN